MAESRMIEVVSELLRLSKANRLAWEKSIRENEYRVVFPDVVFSVSKDVDWGYCQLKLTDDSGQVINSLHIELPSNLDQIKGEPDDPKNDLETIFDLAESYVKDAGINKALMVLKQA